MENYYDFTKFVLWTLGIDLDKRTKHPFMLFLLRYFSLLMIVTVSAQSLLFLLLDKSDSFHQIQTLSAGLFAAQGFVKHFAIIRKQKNILELINDLNSLNLQLETKDKEKSSAFLKRMKKICVTIFIMSNACMWLYDVVPLLSMLVEFITKGKFTKTLPYGIWLPFDQQKYFFIAYCCQIYWGHILSAVPNIMDQLFFLVLAEIVSQFERLGEKMEDVINNSSKESSAITRRDMRKCITKQIKLMNLVDDLNQVYGVPLLAQILSASGIIGLVGFMIMVLKY